MTLTRKNQIKVYRMLQNRLHEQEYHACELLYYTYCIDSLYYLYQTFSLQTHQFESAPITRHFFTFERKFYWRVWLRLSM